VYDCEAIDPSHCMPQTVPSWLYYAAAALAILGLGFLAARMRSRKSIPPQTGRAIT
jgi:hypothetical protein